PAAELNGIYASYVAGIFRTLRFGTAEAHGRAELMEFNVLLEHNAISQGADGRFAIDYAAMPAAIAALDTKLLTFEAQGDRAGVEAWFAKYDAMPQSLSRALESAREIPIDITPEFALSSEARP
ncbi:MAG: Zn-dependent hydrolase, partial [Acidobacteriaceae bacterium]